MIARLKSLAFDIQEAAFFASLHQGVGGEDRARDIAFHSQLHHFFPWRNSLRGEGPVADRQPWMTYDAIKFLKRHLTSEMSVFEWGSGGSTLFFRDRCRRVISVEHDREFFKFLSKQLSAEKSDKNEYRFVAPDDSRSEDPLYQSTHKGVTLKKYAETIDEFPDDFFDVVSVDGRGRNACVIHGGRKVKRGGILVLDNSNRLQYNAPHRLIDEGWTVHRFPGCGPYNRYFWETAVFQKP